MFGYVKVHKPELKICEFEAYKGVYCALCKQMGRDYGILSRLTLSYDLTFLAMLRLAVSSAAQRFEPKRCGFNPFKKCLCCISEGSELAYSAGAALIMTYYKLLDDIHDRGLRPRLRALASFPFFVLSHRKAKREYPELEETVSRMMERQAEAERSGTQSIDAAAEPSARALSEIFSFGIEGEAGRVLSRIGYCIGKWVYVLDAVDDRASDRKTGNYNAFLLSGLPEDALLTRAESILNNCIGEAVLAFELLPIRNYRTILENILYQGLEKSQLSILNVRDKE